MTDQPRPWCCSSCGARLHWRRDGLYCPTDGMVCTLPTYPSEEEQQ